MDGCNSLASRRLVASERQHLVQKKSYAIVSKWLEMGAASNQD